MDERALLDYLQYEFPLVPAPFDAAAQYLGEPVDRILACTQDAFDRGVLRSVRGFFNAGRLNHQSTLVAACVPAQDLEAVAARVSVHPGVSHNYAREHTYNLWFTLTIPDAWDMQETAAALLVGVDDFLLLPAIRLFKIDARFSMAEGRSQPDRQPLARQGKAGRIEFDDADRSAVRALNRSLPLVGRPFARLAEMVGLTQDVLLDRARFFQERGVMRRYGAVLNHRRAGFTANGMTGWVVPSQDVDSVGRQFAGVPDVSHCYERPTYPSWPYNLFTMVHGESREYVDAIVQRMAQSAGLQDYAILYSTVEFKKSAVAYFDPAMEAWKGGA